tara:strand:- start:1183 stop:1806 length:624 start_codon:yes stop_codon:yes gene_type:complete
MKTTEFWTWFQENESEIRDALLLGEGNNEGVLLSLYRHLESFTPCLTCELGWTKMKKHFILTISSFGNSDGFQAVESLVATAPKITKWKIKSFIQPQPDSFVSFKRPYGLFNWNVIPAKIKFAIYDYDLVKKNYDVLLLLPPSFQDKPEAAILKYINSMFLDLWGEKFVGRRIKDIYLTLDRNENFFFLELVDLPFVLNNFKLVMFD